MMVLTAGRARGGAGVCVQMSQRPVQVVHFQVVHFQVDYCSVKSRANMRRVKFCSRGLCI